MIIMSGWVDLTAKESRDSEKEKVDKEAHLLCSRVLAFGNQWACKSCQITERERQQRAAAEAAARQKAASEVRIRELWEEFNASLAADIKRQRTDPAGWEAKQQAQLKKDPEQRSIFEPEETDEESEEEIEEEKNALMDRLKASLAQKTEEAKNEKQLAFELRIRIVESGFRWLAKRWHPDIGGDVATMQELTAARDELIAVIEANR